MYRTGKSVYFGQNILRKKATALRWLIILSVALLCHGQAQAATAANDNFINAIILGSGDVQSVDGATMESGEPQHAAGMTKSLWWKWQAPVNGTISISSAASTASNVVLAVYQGKALGSLKLVTTPAAVVCFPVSGGAVYYIAGAAPADATGDVQLTWNYRATPTPSRAVPGNLLRDPSFEISGPCLPTQYWGTYSASLFWADSLADMGGLVLKLNNPAAGTLSDYIRSRLSEETKQQMVGYYGYPVLLEPLRTLLANDLDSIVKGDLIYDAQRFDGVNVSPEALQLMARNPAGYDLASLNRMLLEDAYPHDIVNSRSSFGGVCDQRGSCDGTIWLHTWDGVALWQDIVTVPGHDYAIRFAFNLEWNQPAGAHVGVFWNGEQSGVGDIAPDELGFWHWGDFKATATSTNTRVVFRVLGAGCSMDAFSVVDLSLPPVITAQPKTTGSQAGHAAQFSVTASGSEPMDYQWYFNNAPIGGNNSSVLYLGQTLAAQSGNYQVVISNAVGVATSEVAQLTVEAPHDATIYSQPSGDTVPAGGFISFCVIAGGEGPLSYQWYRNSQAMTGMTNRSLSITNVQVADAGVYQVIVQAPSSSVWSLPATLRVATNYVGGGYVNCRNGPPPMSKVDAPVYDTDGMTRLRGTNYLVQVYAGASLELLRPIGRATNFGTSLPLAGYFMGGTGIIPTVAPLSNAVVQVRAWERSAGESYEEARACGGRCGKSNFVIVKTGTPPMIPFDLIGLQSFKLQAGIPQFATGVIRFDDMSPLGVTTWTHAGEPGHSYVIEKSGADFVWKPFVIVTNTTSTVTFTDKVDSGTSNAFYRSRILD